MNVPLWLWVTTVLVIVSLICVDFVIVARNPRKPSTREAALWVSFYALLAVAFGAALAFTAGAEHSIAFYTGWVVEYSLSIDNLFILILIIGSFQVPPEHQQRVLLIGIGLALFFRALFIVAGAAAVEAYVGVFYLFGAILLVTAIKLLVSADHDVAHAEYRENALVRTVRRVLPTTDRYHGARLTVLLGGRRHLTPMLLVIIAIGMADIVFALDSIPAIFGITQEPYLVFTANAFALMGLRQLYFLIGSLLTRLVYLNKGLALILCYIGVTLILHAIEHTTDLPVSSPPELVSLGVVVSLLLLVTVASLVASRNHRQRESVSGSEAR
ncbi:TerC/Alx family metal homeostasis membrane protein [Nocardiopsis metallicus]|uniref:Tellurite resistance protein TerC n=1 Tax=Nocardiopsis metallicus TaxID=179819 RepID=A0A840W629_9ACTN|nr:TerC/Alx family metal homeostasis membrane protein [Nocardiopsis metallicus]MBB5490803.1 tellurite resistance protein TerC [Nocardiopsis metallicus]